MEVFVNNILFHKTYFPGTGKLKTKACLNKKSLKNFFKNADKQSKRVVWGVRGPITKAESNNENITAVFWAQCAFNGRNNCLRDSSHNESTALTELGTLRGPLPEGIFVVNKNYLFFSIRISYIYEQLILSKRGFK